MVVLLASIFFIIYFLFINKIKRIWKWMDLHHGNGQLIIKFTKNSKNIIYIERKIIIIVIYHIIHIYYYDYYYYYYYLNGICNFHTSIFFCPSLSDNLLGIY